MARCEARAKATGQRCKRGALDGATVCSKHGASAPQVKAAAAKRLAEARAEVMGLIFANGRRGAVRMGGLIKSQKEQIAFQAAKDSMDRAGFRSEEGVHEGEVIVRWLRRGETLPNA